MYWSSGLAENRSAVAAALRELAVTGRIQGTPIAGILGEVLYALECCNYIGCDRDAMAFVDMLPAIIKRQPINPDEVVED